MTTELMTALLGVIGPVLVALISYRAALVGTRRAAEDSAQLITYRLTRLEESVRALSSLVERVAAAEQGLSAVQRELSAVRGGSAIA